MRFVLARVWTIGWAFVLAFALRLSAAPIGWWWLLVPAIAIAIAFACGDDRTTKASTAFRRGWLFGTTFVLVDLTWVVGAAVAHLGPAMLGFSLLVAALEALPIAVAAWAFAQARRDGFAFCLGVPALYALLETARTSGPLGMPLATFGATQTDGPLPVLLTIGGVPLVSFVAVAVAATIVFLIRSARAARLSAGAFGTIATGLLLTGFAIVVLTTSWNAALLSRSSTPIAHVGIVQAGPIDVGRSFAATAQNYADATQRLHGDVDFALWPEGVLFLTAPDARQQRNIASDAARVYGHPILVGATLRTNGALHNDLLAIDTDGTLASIYSKRRLVPFGEYQPFAFATSNRATYGASTVRSVAPLHAGNAAPFGALICYEIAFDDLARSSANAGAEFLVAVLNDSWFVGSDGPAQLAQLSQVGAIETGIAIARADAVSPSGAIDADGTSIGAPLGVDGTEVVDMPSGIVTPFRRVGRRPTLVGLGILVLAALVVAVYRRRVPQPRTLLEP